MSTVRSDRHLRVVAALIAEPSDAGRFLVQQRLPGVARGLRWEFPGGKVEPGESDAQALMRECREELGVELAVGRRRWSGCHRYDDVEVELVLYEAEILSGTPAPLGAQSLQFLSVPQMRALRFCEADLPLLDALESGTLSRRLR